MPNVPAFLSKIKKLFLKHKIVSSIIIIVLAGGGFFLYQNLSKTPASTKYVLTKAEKGTIVSSLSSSGQVSALNTIDIKAKISGDVVYVGAKDGDIVKTGQLLVQLDAKDAQKAVQSAQNDLDNAKLSTKDVAGNATDAINASFDTGLNTLSTTFKDFTTLKTNLNDLFTTSSYGDKETDMNYYIDFVRAFSKDPSDLTFWTLDAEKKFTDMQDNLTTIEEIGWLLNRTSLSTKIEQSVNDTYTASQNYLDMVRQAYNVIQKSQKLASSNNLILPIHTATITDHITKLGDAITLLTKDSTDLLTSKNDIATKKETVAKIPVDSQTQNLNILQYQNALTDAEDALYQHFMYAPFDGVISVMNVKVGDTASGVVASMITKTMVAEISFGETDIPKIKLGQKATLTFDAIPDLTITGKVSAIDVVGTSSQGVVSYGVKVVMDIQDDRVKPGMSTTATIMTDTRTDALYVPNSAIKTQAGTKYVLLVSENVFDADLSNTAGIILKTAPIKQNVETGLSDDLYTEITSGLNEGDVVVSKTVTATTTIKPAATTNSPANVRIPGVTGGGGGFGGR